MKKTLNWRLKDLPDAVDVAELVDKKVITPEEARQLLFNEGKDEGKKVKELEEEVRFLRDLCDKLAAKSGGWTTVVHEYRNYKPLYPTWYGAYGGVINAVGDTTTSTGIDLRSSTYTVGASSLSTGTTKGLSSLN